MNDQVNGEMFFLFLTKKIENIKSVVSSPEILK